MKVTVPIKIIEQLRIGDRFPIVFHNDLFGDVSVDFIVALKNTPKGWIFVNRIARFN